MRRCSELLFVPEVPLARSASKTRSSDFLVCFPFQGLGGRPLSNTSRSDDDEGEGRSLEAFLAWVIIMIEIISASITVLTLSKWFIRQRSSEFKDPFLNKISTLKIVSPSAVSSLL